MMSGPELDEEVVGYRGWQLDRTQSLMPLTTKEQWLAGPNRARCRNHDHPAPDGACSCGYQAFHDVNPVRWMLLHGAVVGWGAVEVHADGWRSEWAKVVALADPIGSELSRSIARQIAARYGVPFVPSVDLEAEGSRHGVPVPESLRPPKKSYFEPQDELWRVILGRQRDEPDRRLVWAAVTADELAATRYVRDATRHVLLMMEAGHPDALVVALLVEDDRGQTVTVLLRRRAEAPKLFILLSGARPAADMAYAKVSGDPLAVKRVVLDRLRTALGEDGEHGVRAAS